MLLNMVFPGVLSSPHADAAPMLAYPDFEINSTFLDLPDQRLSLHLLVSLHNTPSITSSLCTGIASRSGLWFIYIGHFLRAGF